MALQWELPLVTTDYRDFECVAEPNVVRIG